MRATIRNYQRDYVRQIGALLGTDDPTEVISRIISDHQMRLLAVSLPEMQNDIITTPKQGSEVDESLLGLLE